MITFEDATVKIPDTGVTIEATGLTPSSEVEESFSFHGIILDQRHCSRVSNEGLRNGDQLRSMSPLVRTVTEYFR